MSLYEYERRVRSQELAQELDDEALDDELARVNKWRESQYRRIGYDAEWSRVLARWADYHDVERLVARGCPLALAARIAT